MFQGIIEKVSTNRASSKAVLPVIILAVSLLVSGVYWQVGGHSFIHLDDPIYVAKNPNVLRGLTVEGVRWAFTTFHAANWHPLTWLSHMLDVELFGTSAGWHHRMNWLLHLLNTELLFLVLWRMTGGIWPSAFVAALFGVHPLHVESVAWVAERKDVLSTLFWILTMGVYIRYVERPGVGRYLLVAVSFALGLMCKPMLVTLPFVLLLLDWWPLGRMAPSDPPHFLSGRLSVPVVSRLVWEKVPLLGLSALSCTITYLAQAKGGAVTQFEHIPFGSRISNAFVSYVVYLGKTVWPSSLAVFYPHPELFRLGIPIWQVTGAVLLLGGLTFLAIWHCKRRPYLAVGWLWYLGTLVPVIGLVQVGGQVLADRYTYVPLIGVFIAIAWGVPGVLGTWRFRKQFLVGIGGGVILAMGISAWNQAGYWRDSITLFTRTLKVTEKNWLIWNSLGVAYDELGQPQRAISCYRETLQISPYYAQAWHNLGLAYENSGQPQQAIAAYRETVRIKPDYPEVWNNLGVSYGKLGDHRQAIDSFREAVRIRPDYAKAWYNLGGAYYMLGQRDKAGEVYQQLLRIDPATAQSFLVQLGPAK